MKILKEERAWQSKGTRRRPAGWSIVNGMQDQVIESLAGDSRGWKKSISSQRDQKLHKEGSHLRKMNKYDGGKQDFWVKATV